MGKILIVDDNPGVRDALALLVELEGFESLEADSPASAIKLARTHDIDVAICDMNFERDTTSGGEGMTLFAELRAMNAELPIMLLTAWTHIEQAVSLVKAGAADYLEKPWNDEKLRAAVRNLAELAQHRRYAKLASKRTLDSKQTLQGFDLRGLIAHAPAMLELLRMTMQVARAPVSILITGPNGAGKERIAEIIHYNSSVKSGPFVALNCGAIPQDLVEAELFGSEAGAYTGAQKAREGRFEQADGGTLLLDEIGNLPLAGQMKLLRVLETGSFERLGSGKTRQSSVRVLAATNSDLPSMIKTGQFREDLYYRLNVIELKLPALKDRVEDIAPLAQFFLSQIGSTKTLSKAAVTALLRHHWPGNVRELRNALQRANLLSSAPQIEVSDLNLPERSSDAGEELNQVQIQHALDLHRGVIADAAASLGLSRQAMYRRMEKFGISRS